MQMHRHYCRSNECFFFLFRLLLVLFKPKAHYYALVDDHKFSPKSFKNEEKEQKID